MSNEIVIRRNGTAFKSRGPGYHALVDATTGTVQVWDETAGYYSFFHDLTKRQELSLVAEAKRRRAD